MGDLRRHGDLTFRHPAQETSNRLQNLYGSPGNLTAVVLWVNESHTFLAEFAKNPKRRTQDMSELLYLPGGG